VHPTAAGLADALVRNPAAVEPKRIEFRLIEPDAARGGGANRCGGWLAALAIAGLGCAAEPPLAKPETTRGLAVNVARAPSADERYCAWYGSRGNDDVLYYGQAAFWSAMARADGDPTADLRHVGPQLVGRFDLAAERWLPPLDVGSPESRSGVWDVFAGDDGEVYFTTFFEEAGSVNPASGRVRRLALGGALNELAEGPDGTVVASRYGSKGEGGDVIAFDHQGHTVRRWSLVSRPGYHIAPKTPLWDALRSELWITADQLPDPEHGAQPRQDANAVDAKGRARLVEEPPELMFAAKSGDGTLYHALAEGSQLWLGVVPPPGHGEPHQIPLDDSFASDLDFAQDIQVAPDGRVAVTRWSGIVHVLQPDGQLRSVSLPRPDPAGLYYTAVLHGDRLCATYCADVTVVCVDAP
jgi:hypothetical protein